MCKPGYPHDPDAYVASDLLPEGRTKFESARQWTPLGPFPLAFDMLGDGSVYIVDAAGHCPGHINLLVRISTDGAWILLAGDTIHDRRLFTDATRMAVQTTKDGKIVALMHDDKDLALAHISRVQDFAKENRVQIIFAHDKEWYAENKDGSAFWPGNIQPRPL
jgi:glyoxylase-like metal-dependent hydrolase (beta-lactamase superfamily II)